MANSTAHPQLATTLKGERVSALEDWSSLWANLLHADMLLEARSNLPDDSSNVFIRRGLWEGAVVAYARTANAGRRKRQIRELLTALGPDALDIHEAIMLWRNRHAAHRVDLAREDVVIRAVFERGAQRIEAIEAQVSTVVGPEEHDAVLEDAFRRHVKAARDLVWSERMLPLGDELLADCVAHRSRTLDGARPMVPSPNKFVISVNVIGESTP